MRAAITKANAVNIIDHTVVVNTISDVRDGDTTSIVALKADPGLDLVISLREAIEAANNTANIDATTNDRILFDIPTQLTGASAAHTIALTSELPIIIDAVTIEGISEPDYLSYGNRPVIELDGSGAGVGSSGLVIDADNVIVNGLAINSFGRHGIEIDNGSSNTIHSNYFGTDVTGSVRKEIGNDAILIFDGSNNRIGISQAGNLISGSAGSGVAIHGSLSFDNRVQGNLIGLNATGSNAIGNSGNGIEVRNGAPSSNVIGSDIAALRNVISGNGGSGIHLGDVASQTEIYGNYIGTTGDGQSDLGNGGNGVLINGVANNNFIGNPSLTNAGNIIAFNGSAGIFLNGANVNSNQIQQNSIYSNSLGAIILAGNSNNDRVPPTITSVTEHLGTLSIEGTHADPLTHGDTLRVEFYLNASSGIEGRTFLGAGNFTGDVAGTTFNYDLSVSPSTSGFLTATVTDSAGNTSEFSSSNSIVFVNRAPTIWNGTSPVGSIPEGSATVGTRITDLATALSASDLDGDTVGVALRPLTGSGVYQYSLNTTDGIDGAWTDISNLPTDEYLLLDTNAWLRYKAGLSNAETTSISIRGWDQTAGSASGFNAPATLNPGSGGGDSAFSVEEAILVLQVTDVNNVPSASVARPQSIAEGEALNLDASTSTDSDGSIVSWEWDLDYDRNFDSDFSGPQLNLNWNQLAAYGIDNHGSFDFALRVTDNQGATDTIEFSQDVTNSAPSLTVSGDAEVLQGAPYQLSFSATDPGTNTVSNWVVDWGDGTTESFAVASGTASHVYSSGNLIHTIQVVAEDSDGRWNAPDLQVAVGTRPTLGNSVALVGVGVEDETTSVNFSQLLAATLADDADGMIDGFVIESSFSNTLLLGATQETATAYEAGVNDTVSTLSSAYWSPAANANGLLNAFELRAVDNEGLTSVDTFVAQVDVAAVNDQPVLVSERIELPATDEQTPGRGILVSDLIAELATTDADSDTLGVALTAAAGNGSWQFSVDTVDGVNGQWVQVGEVQDDAALLLSDTSWLRYSPNKTGPENAELNFRVWDGSIGTASSPLALVVFNSSELTNTSAFSSSLAQLSLSVTDVNQAPELDLDTTEFRLAENTDTSQAIFIAQLGVNDDELGRNELTLGGADSELFVIDQGALYLRAGVQLDFEMLNRLEVTVLLNDPTLGATHEDSATVSIDVDDVNEAPLSSIASNSFDENTDSVGGLIAATLTASDPDSNETLTFSIIGGQHQDKFSIRDNSVLVLDDGFLDFERTEEYKVIVRVSDSAGNVYDQETTVVIRDIDENSILILEVVSAEQREEPEPEPSVESSPASAEEETAPNEAAKDDTSKQEKEQEQESKPTSTAGASTAFAGQTLRDLFLGRSRGAVLNHEGSNEEFGATKILKPEAIQTKLNGADVQSGTTVDLESILSLDSDSLQSLLSSSLDDEFSRYSSESYSLIDNSSLTQGMDALRKELGNTNSTEKLVIGSSVTVTTGLSIGYVMWMIRGGVLLSTVLSSLPAWRLIDPLPVLGNLAAASSDEDDDSLQSIIQEADDSAQISDDVEGELISELK